MKRFGGDYGHSLFLLEDWGVLILMETERNEGSVSFSQSRISWSVWQIFDVKQRDEEERILRASQ